MRIYKPIKFIKECIELFRHIPVCMYWSFHDYIFTVYTRLFKNPYVGIYVKVMSPSERWLFFLDKNCGGGFCGYTDIKIFYKEDYCSLESVVDLIKHEVLHQVLRKHINSSACKALDNIHICFNYGVNNEGKNVILIDFVSESYLKTSMRNVEI